MLKTVKGRYRKGKIELAEVPENINDDATVIVTFLETGDVDLRARRISEAEAADLRARLATFAEDWDSPEMEIYDNYDDVKAKL